MTAIVALDAPMDRLARRHPAPAHLVALPAAQARGRQPGRSSALFYLVAIFADFLAFADRTPPTRAAATSRRKAIRCSTTAAFDPHVSGLKGMRDPQTFKLAYAPDPARKLPIRAVRARLSLQPARPDPDRPPSARRRRRQAGERHVPARHRPARARPVLPPDRRDAHLAHHRAGRRRRSAWCSAFCWAASPGLYGGLVDTVIQRVIEILRSIPTIPLWMGLAAALPNTWSVDAGLFRHHADHLADRLDRTGARGARPLPGAARGGFRHRRRTRRRERRCASSSATCCRRSRAHHRRDQPGAAGDDHQRDLAVASSASACGRRRSAGASCCRTRRTCRCWPARRGCCSPRCR